MVKNCALLDDLSQFTYESDIELEEETDTEIPVVDKSAVVGALTKLN